MILSWWQEAVPLEGRSVLGLCPSEEFKTRMKRVMRELPGSAISLPLLLLSFLLRTTAVTKYHLGNKE